ncbi:hypothetical protein [Virgisporangium aurantiacum]|uniref:Uncharacterized protein n=1 Tax=Virgisporangium aurantiacum TaxID=175570 RepID=A0A8J3Z504_9ACTN|nr:hypothetical protein [Virgisporangium aurantiacum]GIJ55055.1 hypothetical protein Vau01_025710 [Virgisporangium aurantiacum]
MHKPLKVLAAVMCGLAAFSLVGLVVDDRTVLGVPVWLKPLKFGLSFGVYAVTMAWLIPHLTKAQKVAWWAGTVMAVFGLLEVGLIAFQAARGRMSHFNQQTALDGQIFTAMGVTIGIFYLGVLATAVLLLIQRVGDRALTWTLRLGLLIAMVGMGLGFLMVLPSDAQIAAGEQIVGAHSVGVEDGGPGMPVTGWSTTGGDLRIPHFVGMHALQILPLLLFALTRVVRDEAVRLRLMVVAAATYAAVLVLVTWQALRGQPLVHPDAATLVAAGLIAAVAAVGGAAAMGRRARA